jgi:hypothetical protein
VKYENRKEELCFKFEAQFTNTAIRHLSTELLINKNNKAFNKCYTRAVNETK